MDKTFRCVERDADAEIHFRTRRGFLIAGAATVTGGGFWQWLNDRPQINSPTLNFPWDDRSKQFCCVRLSRVRRDANVLRRWVAHHEKA